MRLQKPDERLDFFVVVLDGGREVGRIFRFEKSWGWRINVSLRHGKGPHQGFEPTRKDAMGAFRAAWDLQQH
jgi:hypothetical protein